jgi:protein-disulfide isomerase
MSIRLRFLAAAALAATLASSTALAQAPGPFSPEQRKAIGEIVKEYLIQNPEVLQEAIAELEKRQQEAQRVAQSSALKESQEQLLNSPRGNVVGNPQGDVTLVEFFDYNCGYCKRALADLRDLMRKDGKLRVVLKDFPVLGPESVEASRVALAAKQQLKGERLFDYHAKLLETRGRVNGERAKALAKEMGLDMARLDRDVEGEDVRLALQENMSLGDRLGISGTPAFIIGEEIVPGAVGAEPLRKVVAGVRQCGKATC